MVMSCADSSLGMFLRSDSDIGDDFEGKKGKRKAKEEASVSVQRTRLTL